MNGRQAAAIAMFPSAKVKITKVTFASRRELVQVQSFQRNYLWLASRVSKSRHGHLEPDSNDFTNACTTGLEFLVSHCS